MNQSTSSHTRLSLDGSALLQQLNQLGEIGQDLDAGGRTRIALSDSEKAGRDQLVSWMQELDMEIHIDSIGNIIGLLRASRDDGQQSPFMMGSHIDTVANAGALDGCYGVLAGLAVVRAFRAAGCLPDRTLAVVAFTNEEGVRYQPDMMGSLVYAGGLPVETALDTEGTDGTRLGDELSRIGYAGSLEPGAIVPHEYIELHIEQGPVLESDGLQIGVVENLQGISWQQISIEGTANHAGTTPTRLRHDAGWAASAINTFLRQIAVDTGTTLATIGSIQLEPGLINVIPRKAVLSVDLRDPNEERLQAAERQLADYLTQLAEQEGLSIQTESLARFKPVTFDADLADAIAAASDKLGLSARRMTSGAGHDAQMIARIAPSAMIFVPSQDGISHNPREHTDDDDLINGAQVLLDVVCNRVGIADQAIEK